AAVQTFGSPLYLYDVATLKENCARLLSILPADSRLLYSLKANPNPALVQYLLDLGLGMEVCSCIEFQTALRAGPESADIVIAGPGKSFELLNMAVANQECLLVVESLREFERICCIARQQAGNVRIALRINSG